MVCYIDPAVPCKLQPQFLMCWAWIQIPCISVFGFLRFSWRLVFCRMPCMLRLQKVNASLPAVKPKPTLLMFPKQGPDQVGKPPSSIPSLWIVNDCPFSTDTNRPPSLVVTNCMPCIYDVDLSGLSLASAVAADLLRLAIFCFARAMIEDSDWSVQSLDLACLATLQEVQGNQTLLGCLWWALCVRISSQLFHHVECLLSIVLEDLHVGTSLKAVPTSIWTHPQCCPGREQCHCHRSGQRDTITMSCKQASDQISWLLAQVLSLSDALCTLFYLSW